MSATGRLLNPPMAGPLNPPRGAWVRSLCLGRLVVDRSDPAVRVGAKLVLRSRVRVSACIRDRRRSGLNDADVQGLAVRLAQHLIERAVVRGVQRARRAMSGNARVAALQRRCRMGRCGLDGATLPPAPVCAAIVNVAPSSVTTTANMDTMPILIFIRILLASLSSFRHREFSPFRDVMQADEGGKVLSKPGQQRQLPDPHRRLAFLRIEPYHWHLRRVHARDHPPHKPRIATLPNSRFIHGNRSNSRRAHHSASYFLPLAIFGPLLLFMGNCGVY